MSEEAKEILSRSLVHQIERLRAERDELRAENEKLRDAVNGKLFDKALKAFDENDRLTAERDALRAELAAEREKLEKFRKLDVEAAKYCELPIISRTKFTGEPPYVGWKGLGLAMCEAFDERDALRATLREAYPHVWPGERALADSLRARIDAALSKGGEDE